MVEDNGAKGEDAVFLSQGAIFPWERPGEHYFGPYLGSTELVEFKGHTGLTQNLGKFLVVATAARYIADVIRAYSEFNLKKGEPDPAPVRELLFWGGITIFKNGEITGTKLRGYDLKRVGEIWTATPDLEADLHQIIFGTANEELIKRVEMILKGYEIQDENERRARHARDRETFYLGRESGEADAIGNGV